MVSGTKKSMAHSEHSGIVVEQGKRSGKKMQGRKALTS
jgi:hypothetical protein